MGLTAQGKNEALAGATGKMTYVGLLSSVKKAVTSNTAIGASLFNMTGAAAAGWTNEKVVVLRALTGAVTGNLVVGRAYWIIGSVTNGFELALERGGVAIKVAGHEVEASTEFALLTELTGGSYLRVKTTWGSASLGEIADTAAEAIKVPAGEEITDVGWWSVAKQSEETHPHEHLFATAKLENAEKYTGEGEYKVTSDKVEANAVA